ncbi:TMV resistance protein N, partial [Mucuna pruriens]
MASNSIIQCSSSSSHAMRTYDTHANNFTGFLFEALCRKGIDAFKDDADIKKGESIAPELLQAIEGSRIFVVVFSKNYASATWCLRELAHIFNCFETSQTRVLPIFYDVDSSEVRKQSEYYGKAFAKHEERFREDKEKMEEVQRWREAMTRVANLSGWDIRNRKDNSCIISHQYDFCCYIGDVSKIYGSSGTLGVQKQLFSQSLDEKGIEICNVSKGTFLVWTRLRRAWALIVLDKVEMLNMFTGSRDTLLRECLGGGSRIIIISRDQQILKTHGVDDIYLVQPLNCKDAFQLFCKKAFKSDDIMSDYKQLTNDMLSHVEGHPLAIEILGSTLSGRDVLQWRSALARLREKKSKNIMDVLRISFDELEDIEKEIFLDIACFFYSTEEEYVKEILDFRGFHPEYGLQVLIDKSLITVMNGRVHMHHLLSDLGKCIVREKSPKKPSKWTENLEAIVLDNPYISEKTIRVDALSKMRHLKLLTLIGMKFAGRVDYLSNELGYINWEYYPFEYLPQSFQPDSLVQLCLPCSNIKQLWEVTKPLPNLRDLDLCYSKNLIEMPDFGEALNLEMLDLQGCMQLTKIYPSIGLLRKLTFLRLTDCKNLVSLPNSILGLNSLEYLNLSGCSKLYNIQLLDEPRDAEHLKKLYIGEAPIHSQSASSYSRAHNDSVICLLPPSPIFPSLHSLDLSFCNLLQIPDAIGNLSCLEILDLSGNSFATLPNLKELSKLFILRLQHCKQLKYLSELPSRIDFLSPPCMGELINPGLYVYNCPELVARECCTSMCFSWMIRNVQVHDPSFLLSYLSLPLCVLHQSQILNHPRRGEVFIHSVTPGSEIPRWFNNQHVSMDSYMSIDASPVMHDNNWIGVAYCAVFVVRHGRVTEMDFPKCFSFLFFMLDNLYVKRVSSESDHIWLFFVSRRQFMKACLYQGTPCDGFLKLEFDLPLNSECHVKVKKYRYRWVYKQDLELSNITMMHGRNPLVQKHKKEIKENEAKEQRIYHQKNGERILIQRSSSSSNAMRTYDVFVSFRGEDTRNSFTDFLFQALRRKAIDAFKDDTHLNKGESIAPELLQAIHGSRIFIVVFSQNYASSTWCLCELAQICNCVQTSPRHVLPIFYDVDPSEVRKQSGYYEKAFVEHEESFKKDKERMKEVQRWKEALTRMANFSGWDIRNKPQYPQIEEIVENITNILGHKFSSLPNDKLVGMKSRVEELEELLHLRSVKDVRVVGISGMGGIGKTTLVRALYERISHQYDLHCFIDDVSKIYRDSSTLGVQKKLLLQSLNEKNLEICNVSEGTCLLWTRLRHARALIVFDNVDQVGQLKMFTGSRDTLLRECLGGGSRIIIISRDQHILRTHGVDDVYQVQELDHKDAIQLFCRNAFKSDYIMSGYKKLTYEVLSHAQGHPLAVEVFGSSLFGRDVLQWKSALARLSENKSKSIMDMLRISFDQLEDTEKEIFLDIACFFYRDKKEEYVKEILEFRGFHPEYGLELLIDKSLIVIKDGTIRMHDLLRDLGRYIVREKSPKETRNWSRLWDYKDLTKVLSDNMAAKNLEAIVVEHPTNIFPKTPIRADALSKMSHLKLLKLFPGSLNYLSNELGYFYWWGYPFECLPSSFQPDNLVELFMPHSNIKQLWKGTK